MSKLTILVMVMELLMFGVVSAEAADVTVTVTIEADLSVSLGAIGSWAIGDVAEGGEEDTYTAGETPNSGNNFTATNDGNLTEDFTVTVVDSANWTFVDAAGDEDFAMSVSTGGDTPAWNVITVASGYEFGTSIAAEVAQSFDLKFFAPTNTAYGATQQTITVTITASAS